MFVCLLLAWFCLGGLFCNLCFLVCVIIVYYRVLFGLTLVTVEILFALLFRFLVCLYGCCSV